MRDYLGPVRSDGSGMPHYETDRDAVYKMCIRDRHSDKKGGLYGAVPHRGLSGEAEYPTCLLYTSQNCRDATSFHRKDRSVEQSYRKIVHRLVPDMACLLYTSRCV